MRVRARTLGAAALALLLALGVARDAAAHGALRRASPAADARLDAAPRELRLTFNEAVELAVARLELRGPDGAPVALSALRRGDSAAVVVADVVGPLAAGAYTVAWQVVGRDGHPVRGSYAFTILPGAAGLAADPPATAPVVAPPPDPRAPPAEAAPPARATFDAESPLFAAVRWLGFVGLLGAIGTVAYGLGVAPRARRDALDAAPTLRALASIGLAAVAMLLVAAGLRLVAQAAALGEGNAVDASLVASVLRDTRWGAAWLAQVAAALAAGAGFALLPRAPGAGWALAALGAAGAAAASAVTGHAAALTERAALGVAADALHVVAAGGWLGALLVLVAVGLPAALRAAPAERAPRAAALLRAFAPLALACAAAVVLTGAVAAWLHVGGVGALVASRYGRVLLAKLALVAAIVLLGAWNYRRGRAGLATEDDARGVRRAATAELAVGALVLAATAVLVATPTPADAG